MVKTKFKVGDKVKWYSSDNKRIDVITDVTQNVYGDVCYFTKETNNTTEKAKVGKAYESYLVPT